MDLFVYNKLTEWGFNEWIERFREEEVDTDSLYSLEEHEINHLISKAGPRAKFKKRLQELKSQQLCAKVQWNEQMFEEATSDLVLPSTSNVCGKDNEILKDVKSVMTSVQAKLNTHEHTELSCFLSKEIDNLWIDKREKVGVFGQTGAGKSSLINAIIGEKDLLPTGSLSACTTVVINVEANTQSKKYETEIEFITEMEWKDELWSLKNLFGDRKNKEKECDDEYNNSIERFTAFYGDNWKNKSFENLMAPKFFKEIPEFLHSKRKIVTGESAKELSIKIVKYTRSGSEEVQRCYWPLVKSVTVRVPDNALLQHVTLVDLPGNGDRNKSRDQMWKGIIGSCTTVWIVTNMNRAAADRDAWEILENACCFIGNAGQCQNIYFICTKTDIDADEGPNIDVRHNILQKNMSAKDIVKKEFNKLTNKKHFRDDFFQVFTVSSKEFLKPKYLRPKETEIPKLREFLQFLNELHGQTFNCVCGAYRILSQMKEASCGKVAEQQTEVCAKLNETIRCELFNVRTSMQDAYRIFDQCLTIGVEKSRHLCEASLKKRLQHESGSAFHTTLKSVVENKGIHTPKNGETINLNSTLSSFLTESINEDFRKAFPNDGKSGYVYSVIDKFSLGTVWLTQKYRALELHLMFLKTEEEKMKNQLYKIIRNRKTIIYSSLTQTVEEIMQECYKKAATFTGKGSLENMRHTIEKHVQDVKDTMFDQAKDAMLKQLKQLMEDVLKVIGETLQKSIKLSFYMDKSIPDITAEFEEVTKHYNELMSTEEEASLLLSDSEES